MIKDDQGTQLDLTGEIKPAVNTMNAVKQGRFMEEVDAEVNKLARAVGYFSKGGSVTIKIHMQPFDGDGSVLNVKGEVTSTLPKPTNKATVMYNTPDGNPQLRNPEQADLGKLAAVSTPDQPQPLRETNDDGVDNFNQTGS